MNSKTRLISTVTIITIIPIMTKITINITITRIITIRYVQLSSGPIDPVNQIGSINE